MDNIDIWRAAHQMMKRYGEKASMEAASRSNAALEAGETLGYEIWMRVANAINELERSGPSKDDPVH
jgi:hypothetical protein